MRRSFFVVIFCLLAWLCAGQGSFQGLAQTLTLHARTNLVPVPTLVESKTGAPVFGLTAKDFLVKDNGVEQKNLHLDTETDKAPISLVVLLQVGRAAAYEFYKMQGLPTMLDALPGDTPHRIALVEFDSSPRLLQNFTSDDQQISSAFQSIRPGDDGAAVFDAVWYAVDMLQDEPQQDQRAILLISETRDHGSRTPVQALVHKIGASNAIVYSLTFSPARTEVLSDLKHGGGKGLLEPFIFAVQALRKNAAAAIPQMTGGEYLRFNNGKGLDNKMALLTNQIHNRYMLSFQPQDPKPGLHLLQVTLRQDIGAKVLARTSYWADAPSAQVPESTPDAPPPEDQP